MYSTEQIGLASLFGTPILGWWLIGANYAAMGRTNARWTSTVLGSIATVFAYAFTIVLTSEPLILGYGLALWAATFGFARFLQADAFVKHLEEGGTRYSWWRVLLITGIVWTGAQILVGFA